MPASGRPPTHVAIRVAIAMLAAAGEQQAAIGKRFNLTQSTVSRVLAEALSRGWLRRSVSFEPEGIDAETLREAKQRAAQPPRLEDAIGHLAVLGHLPHAVTVRVFACADARHPAASYEKRQILFGASVAHHVRELLAEGVSHCGLTWGHSIAAVVAGIEALGARPPRSRRVQMVPLCGEPLGRDQASLVSSSVLAARLAKAVNGTLGQNLSLAMLPAFIPGDFAAVQVDAVWRLIGKMHAYEAIFGSRRMRTAGAAVKGSEERLALRLDMILTGISIGGHPLGDGRGPLFESGGLREETFRELVLADIGGVLIERGKLTRGQKAALTGLKARWTGLNEEELRACANRAAAPEARTPGVVVVAIGRAKAEPLIAAIQRGLVNRILIDAELEAQMLQMLGSIG
jgi:DNA-binding transcriptional regulator LsrR (DeoR family)